MTLGIIGFSESLLSYAAKAIYEYRRIPHDKTESGGMKSPFVNGRNFVENIQLSLRYFPYLQIAGKLFGKHKYACT